MQNHQHQHLKIHSLSCQAPTKQPIQVVSGSNKPFDIKSFISKYVFIDKAANKGVTRIFDKEKFSLTEPSINHEIMLHTKEFNKFATESMLQVVALLVYFSASHKYITVGIKELSERTGVCIREVKYILAQLESLGFFTSLYNGKKKWKTYKVNAYVLSRGFLKPLAKRMKWLWGVLSVKCTLLINNSAYSPFYKEWLSRKRLVFIQNQNTKNSYNLRRVTHVTKAPQREEYLDNNNTYTCGAYQNCAQSEFNSRISAKDLFRANFIKHLGEKDGVLAYKKETDMFGGEEEYFKPKDLTHPKDNYEFAASAKILHQLNEAPLGEVSSDYINDVDFQEVFV